MCLVEVIPQVAERSILIKIQKNGIKEFALSLSHFLRRKSNKVQEHASNDPAEDEIILIVRVPNTKDLDAQVLLYTRLIQNYTDNILRSANSIFNAIQQERYFKVQPIKNPLEAPVRDAAFLD